MPPKPTAAKQQARRRNGRYGQPRSTAAKRAAFRAEKVPVQVLSAATVAAGAMERLLGAALEYARGHGYPVPLPNPAAVTGAAAAAFTKALRGLGYDCEDPIRRLLDEPVHHTFGFHGTNADAISSIFADGFDPARRVKQDYGAGEYFDLGRGEVAQRFAEDTKCLIVVLIVKGPHVKETTQHSSGVPIAVVDNPMDRSVTYCLPCAVVTDIDIPKKVRDAIRTRFPEEIARFDLDRRFPDAPAQMTDGFLC